MEALETRNFLDGTIHKWIRMHPADEQNYRTKTVEQDAWSVLVAYTKGQCWRDAPAKTVKMKFSDHSILHEAQQIIYGDREQTYGSPDKNLQLIADLWSEYIGGCHLNVTDVCNLMILLKVARLRNQPTHRDSQVDICGYAALIERVQNQRKEKEPVVNEVNALNQMNA